MYRSISLRVRRRFLRQIFRCSGLTVALVAPVGLVLSVSGFSGMQWLFGEFGDWGVESISSRGCDSEPCDKFSRLRTVSILEFSESLECVTFVLFRNNGGCPLLSLFVVFPCRNLVKGGVVSSQLRL